jgi:glycosyltransferase involved in cell wall biosynthesis
MIEKFKILYIANIRIPTEKAHGHQIMKMCEVFSEQGVDLQLIVPDKVNPNLKKISPFDYYSIKNNFTFKKIRVFDPIFLLKFKGNFYIKFQLLIFNVRLFFYLLFNKITKKDILYTRDEYLLPLLQRFSKKVVWESHSLPKNIKYYLRFFKNCHKILVLTQKIKDDLVNLGIKSENIYISPDAVALDIFDIDIDKNIARERLSLPKDKIILGYTGSLTTKGMDKGVEDIFKSLTYLPKEILFVAVGGAKQDINEYREKAKNLGVQQQVLFVEKISHSDLAIYQKVFDILLMPFPNEKHYAYYMSPLKMFEYMASQRPIVASDLPSIREVLNENNAIFCEPDNAKDLAHKIKKLIDNPSFGDKISQQAYADIKKYTWGKRVKNIINFIKI